MPDVSLVARTRIVIADEHPLFREGLRRVIGAEPDMQIVGEATDSRMAVAVTQALSPDLLLFDVSMSGMSGVEAVRELSYAAPRTCVLLLSAGVADRDLCEALRYGVRGLVLKTSTTELILKAIRRVVAGEYWFSRDLVGSLARALAAATAVSSPAADKRARLTAREHDVVQLLADGMANKEIAKRLSVSEDTVKHHLTSAFSKTGTSSRVELAFHVRKGSLESPAPKLPRPPA